jgi:hypothetical protein
VEIEGQLKDSGLYEITNIIVVAERGLTSAWKSSHTTTTQEVKFMGGPDDELPPGFLAMDVFEALLKDDPGLTLFDPDNDYKKVPPRAGQYPKHGNAVIAAHPSDPQVTIEARGGYDIVYLPQHMRKAELRRLTSKMLDAPFRQDHVGGAYVNEKRMGSMPGALSLKHIGWESAKDRRLPDLVITFVSVNLRDHPVAYAATVADTTTKKGDDVIGAFSRSDTWNFTAARGPDFAAGTLAELPRARRTW